MQEDVSLLFIGKVIPLNSNLVVFHLDKLKKDYNINLIKGLLLVSFLPIKGRIFTPAYQRRKNIMCLHSLNDMQLYLFFSLVYMSCSSSRKRSSKKKAKGQDDPLNKLGANCPNLLTRAQHITGLVVKWYDMALSKPVSRVRSPSNLKNFICVRFVACLCVQFQV